MFTVLFALGRLPGWIAQWREMIEDPATKIGRPRQVYVGSRRARLRARRPALTAPANSAPNRPFRRPPHPGFTPPRHQPIAHAGPVWGEERWASASTERKSAASWTFDVCRACVGGRSIGLLAIARPGRGRHLDRHWVAALLLGPPVIALMSRFPLVLTAARRGIEVGFDSAVLVFLACFDGGAGALAVWSVGQAISQLTRAQAL